MRLTLTGKFKKDSANMRSSFIDYIIISLLAAALISAASGQSDQTLTLDQCQAMAVEYSTLLKQKSLQQQAFKANAKAENIGYLPQAELGAQVTYQSDVTGIPLPIPGVEAMSKDQYKATLDLRQVIYDGGYIGWQKRLAASGSQVEQSRLSVEVQQLKERVNGLYLGILLINENIRLVEVLKRELTANTEKLSAMLKSGVAFKSNVDILKVEGIKADQKIIELVSNKTSMLGTLSILLGRVIPEQTVFVQPVSEPAIQTASSRPEYKLFDLQRGYLQNQSSLINSRHMPKIFLFGNGGYGRPALNMLNNDFDWFYIAGVKLTIPLTSWADTHHRKHAIALQQAIVDWKKEAFSRNNRMQINQQLNEIEKYRRLIEKDKVIITLRTGIKQTQSVKLENGVITSSDFVSELNAENQAMLNLKLHEIQLIQSIINYNALKGSDTL